MFRIIFLAALLCLSQPAEAREFFKRSGQLRLTYSNIITGTAQVAVNVPFEFRYSDDDRACLLIFGNEQIACGSTRSNSTEVVFGLKATSMEQFMIAVLTAAGQPALRPSMSRILRDATHVERGFRLEYWKSEGAMQLHDIQPESFHVYFAKLGAEIALVRFQ
ncbi:MAG TPA: hypothetical protein VFV50_09700 [Bdellovibrionales bacterium]|nr:hypothetical protein [Bdellovibrionales bacterium]